MQKKNVSRIKDSDDLKWLKTVNKLIELNYKSIEILHFERTLFKMGN
jgi:hypothetical protein